MSTLTTGALGGTYGGSAISCAAAVATLDVFEREKLLENARVRGEQLLNGMRSIAQDAAIRDSILEVRGLGLFLAIEFKPSLKGVSGKVVSECRNNSLLMLAAGAHETVRLLPPLIVTEQQANQALEILRKSINKVLSA
jgi:4-aminobutyrate aminotransferase